MHHEFSQTLTEADEECIEQIVTYIAERNSPFDTAITTKVTNIVTWKEVNKETSSFLINCKKIDIKKETIMAIRNIDYARLQN